MSKPEDFPNVHAAFGVYMEYFKKPPQNATILVKWCQKQSISGIKYANVNKYFRLRKNEFEEEKKKNKPVVKSSTQKYKNVPEIKKSNTTQDLLSRFNQAMEESKKTYTSRDLGFDKGQTKSTNFNTKFFEEQVQKEKEQSQKTHSTWKKRTSIETKDIQISLNEVKEEDILSKYDDNEIDQELGIDGELINELDQINDVEDFDFTSKYVKRNEPWLRLKLYWTEDTRMSKDSNAVKELKEWLEKNKFGQFFDKLYECGVESLADLRALKNDEEITELTGPQGISMGVVFRRKFIKAVNNLKSEPPTQTTKEIEDNPQIEPPNDDNNNNESKKSGVSQIEKESLDRLVDSIKSLTFELRGSRNNLKLVKEQTSKVRQDIAETFDKAIGILVMRRKQLESSLNELEEDTSKNIKGNVIYLQKSAKALLICKSKIESKIKTLPNDDDRSNIVKSEVQEALNTIPEKKSPPNILFDKGNTELEEFLENYGQVCKEELNENNQND